MAVAAVKQAIQVPIVSSKKCCNGTVQQTRSLKVNTMSLFLGEVRRVVEKMVASMHKESFAADDSGEVSGVACSGFMKEMVVSCWCLVYVSVSPCSHLSVESLSNTCLTTNVGMTCSCCCPN